MWGTLAISTTLLRDSRNTPTRVGNTQTTEESLHWIRKHPHACGEHLFCRAWATQFTETPPRVWGTLILKNTKKRPIRKHPHACGEHCSKTRLLTYPPETPPRVWGTRRNNARNIFFNRNTPTRVGNTCWTDHMQIHRQKHPHACGEHYRCLCPWWCNIETPPRVWGTPRAAEFWLAGIEKHPHACGEHQLPQAKFLWDNGNTPTRVGNTHILQQ